jgi:hypothetical protein
MIPLFLIFSQLMSFQAYFYPLILFSGIIISPFQRLVIKLPLTGKNFYFFWFYLFFLLLIFIFDYLRGASLELIIWNLRFFYGIGFVIICFRLINNLYIGRAFFWTIVLIGVYESLSLNLFDTYPWFWDYTGYESKFLLKRVAQDGFYSILGPTLNSSISGTIYAVIFFILLKNRNNSTSQNIWSDTLLIFLSILCVILTSSTVAYAVFLAGVIINIANILKSHKIIVFYILFVSIILLQFAPIFNSLNFEPVSRVLIHKYESLTVSYNISQSIFGWNSLSDISSLALGGDFIFLHQFLLNGIVLTGVFLYSLYRLTPPNYRLFLTLGILSTFHYGTLYTLLGQLFFGAIIANKLKL